MCMGCSDKKGDGLANQPRRYQVPGHLGLTHTETQRAGCICRLPLVLGKHERQLAWRPLPSHLKCQVGGFRVQVLDALRPRGGNLVGTGDIVPTAAWWGALHDKPAAWWRSPPGSRRSEPCPSPPSSFCHSPAGVFLGLLAGALPLRRPPDNWLPGVPALPGPCYWLVASGIPMVWHGGGLAAGMVRGALRHYCPGPCWCVFDGRGWLGGRGLCRFSSPPPIAFPHSRPSRCELRVTRSGCPLSSPAGKPFHVVCVFGELGLIALPVRALCRLFVRVLAHPQWWRLPPSPYLLARPLRGPLGGHW